MSSSKLNNFTYSFSGNGYKELLKQKRKLNLNALRKDERGS